MAEEEEEEAQPEEGPVGRVEEVSPLRLSRQDGRGPGGARQGAPRRREDVQVSQVGGPGGNLQG